MASEVRPRGPSALDVLLDGPPGYWVGLLALATPWVRFELGAWTLYPGHLALSALLAAAVLSEPGWGAAVRPLAPLLALGAWVAALAALRGELAAAGIVAGLTALHFCWGAAAMRLGAQGRPAGELRVAMAGLLALTLAVGLAGWALQALWPAGCRVFNCAARAHWPYPFSGGWGSAAQYVLLLLFVLAPLGGPLLAALSTLGALGTPGRDPRRWVLPALGAAAGLAMLAGAPLWALLLAALGWVLLARLLGPARRDPQRLLLRGLAAGGLFALLVVYGLEPGYLHRLWGSATALPPVRVTLPEPAPRQLSSERALPLAVQVRNTGWSRLGSNSGGPLRVGLEYLVTPERGTTREVEGPWVALPGALGPGEARTLRVPVRLPPWVKDGYLTWRLALSDGSAVPLARGSLPGFRFSNAGYRRLALDADNQLSSLAERARAFQREAQLPTPATPDAHSAGMVLGDVLDTVFFSPLWGEREPRAEGSAFTQQRPFLPSLLHQYGLIGLALAGWAAWRLLQRALACAAPGQRGWQLLPLALVLLAAAGLFTPVLGSYHSHWAFFLLAGFLEGRYARRFPWPSFRLAPRRFPWPPWRLRLPLPWRMGAPQGSHAGRVRRR
jgi:hypothetical protein